MTGPEGGSRTPSWRDRVVTSLRWSAAGRLLGQLWNWGVTLFVIQQLAPTDYGLMATAMIFVGMALTFRDMGVNTAVMQFQDVTEEDLRSCKTAVHIVAISLGLLIIGLSFPLGLYYGEPQVQHVVQALAVAFLLLPVGMIEYAVLCKNLQFKRVSLVDLTASFCGSLVSLSLAYLGAGVWALVGALLCQYSMMSLGYLLVSDRRIRFGRSLTPAGRFFRFGMPVSLQAGVFTLGASMTNFLIGSIHGIVALGLYTVSQNLSNLTVSKAMPIVSSVMMPAFSAVQDQFETLHKSYLFGAEALLVLFIASLWGLAGTADALVPLVLGEKWRPAIALIQIASIWAPLVAITHLCTLMANALGHPGQSVAVYVVNVALSVVAVGLTVLTDIQGCVAALGVAAILTLMDAFRRLSAILKRPFWWFLKPFILPMVAGFAMLAAVFLLRDYGPQPFDGVVNLLTRIGVGAITFLGVLLLLGRARIREYRAVLLRR